MARRFLLVFLAPLASSCAQPYAVRFETRAFPTRAGQRVVITTARGRTEIRGVVGSREIVAGGTILTEAGTLAAADGQARAVRIIETTLPPTQGSELHLNVGGIAAGSSTSFDSQFLVPKDIRLEIHDGPEDLVVEGVEGGVTIDDGAGDIRLRDITGPVIIRDLDGNIFYYQGKGELKITDRRGDIVIEEVTGDVDISDREDDALIESVTGNVVLGKQGRGTVRINNLDGQWVIREWTDNPTQPIINTIWREDAPGKAAPSSGKQAGPARHPVGPASPPEK